MVLELYRFITQRFAFLIRRYLKSRAQNGKEDATRLNERYGQTTHPRPPGNLIWIHAVSVGESMSSLALIEKLLETQPNFHILMTTGTVTAARIMDQMLPKSVTHQYIPVDVPAWIEKFLDHWHPQLALWLESELWPNMIQSLQTRKIPLFLLNGRVSDQAYQRWWLIKKSIAKLLKTFQVCFAQSNEDQERLKTLGAPHVRMAGNLKFAAHPLAVNEKEMQHIKTMIKNRPLWVAASTHEGEEIVVAQAHQIISQAYPEALCIIIPRHPHRALEIMTCLKDYPVARRSLKQPITPQTQIYLADTLNELGLFYRLAPAAFIGGSLVSYWRS